MKKFLLILIVIIGSISLTGCWRYGEGKTLGYITTIETGIFWDYVWIRAELESSQTNAYAIRKDRKNLKDALIEASKHKQRVELYFYNHVSMASMVEGLGGEGYHFEEVKD